MAQRRITLSRMALRRRTQCIITQIRMRHSIKNQQNDTQMINYQQNGKKALSQQSDIQLSDILQSDIQQSDIQQSDIQQSDIQQSDIQQSDIQQ
jgi:hypothetical protein